jgi:predicted ATPase/class 3 adenylate cyclase
MKCLKCQFENPEDSKFCFECGHKFELRCPHCGKTLPINVKFCNECGHNLGTPPEAPPKDLSFDEKLEKIQRYLPKGLTEKILSQRNRIEGERKQVTVMFCDMESFTQFSERLGPEEAYTVMDQVYEILIHKVHDYEGTVNEFTGDGIMALFGAPIALEDAPQRAIRSGYAIHWEMSRFSEKIKQEKQNIPRLKMRIGIHTGPVVVGTLGNDLRVEFKAVGDTVNLASRMEGLAEPGSTYVTEETFRLTEGLFRFEALGEYAIKGKAETVKAYRVIAPSTRRTRFDVSADRGLTPFVGRQRELELLLDGFERSKAGRGQAISIMAEAGIGKSRLLYEFRKAVANEDVTFLEGRCLSYSRSVAYHPVIDTLKSNFDIREEDGDLEIREKVKRGLKILAIDETSTLPYLLELLSVKESGIDKTPMSPEARRVRIIEALNRIVLKGSEIRSLIMAIEDLHWIDKSSEERFKSLLDSISGARVFLIFTYRPEFVHTWGGKSYHSQVNLNRLSNRESLTMMIYLLGTDAIESGLEEFILEKTEGVPFFIEEFIKSLKDLQIIKRKENSYRIAKDVQTLTIPSTIQDVIMARVDSLPETAKEVLQTGSVIEREFSYELIKRVTGIRQEELLSHLSVLKDSELLYESGIYPQSTYIFKHALTQEVVRDSILTKRKRRLYEKIGNAIEEIFKENLDEHYGVLAEHYIKSEHYEKAAEYSSLAGRKAERAVSFTDAIVYGKKRISCLEKMPVTDDVNKKIIDARTTLGLYMGQLFYFSEAKETIEPIIDLALKIHYKKRLSQIYTVMGAHKCWVEEDFPEAFRYLEDSLKISKEVNDTVSLFFGSVWLGYSNLFDCEFEKAIRHIQKAISINEAANNLWGTAVMKANLSRIYGNQGKVRLCSQTSEEALRIAEESGDIYSKASAYTTYGLSLYLKGFFEEAEKFLLQGMNFSEKINFYYFNAVANHILGDTYFSMGNYPKSIYHYRKAISLLEHAGFLPSWIYLIKTAMERAKVMNNEKDIEFVLLYDHVPNNRQKIYDGVIRRHVAEVLLYAGENHIISAEKWINEAIEKDTNNGMMWHLARDYDLYAELFKRKGNLSNAKENLNKAIEIYKECGADGWVEMYKEDFVKLQ